MELKSKVCLITGGKNGIGAATALELARKGADIVINGLTIDENGEALRRTIESLGVRCILSAADISRPEQAIACVQDAAEKFGHLDVLIHSAGTAAPGSLLEVSPETWYAAFDIHVHAVFHLCRAAVPVMRPQGEGSIVLVSSAAGARGCLGALAYGVAKGALPQFTRALARELADDNIRVNCVSPGVIRTRFQNYLTPQQVANNLQNRIPLHREGQPQDVASAIALLVQNEFITGETLTIDGGMTMRMV